MMHRGLLVLTGLIIAAATLPAPTVASVVVLVNRTNSPIALTYADSDGRQVLYTLGSEGAIPVPADNADGAATVVFDVGGRPRRQTLHGDGIYEFRDKDGNAEWLNHPLPGFPVPTTRPAAAKSVRPSDAVRTIPIEILADDKEPTVRRLWEKRYRDRLSAASDIIERCCRVRFKVAAVGTWHSKDGARDLSQLIAEFERTVKPDPAWLAIGFTGRHEGLQDQQHMGGTRGPCRRHILIREWGHDVSESERLEMLVHELGHYLGAVHSAEKHSVMRPDISDRQARARSFHIGFDAPNTLAMYLVGEELRSRAAPLAHLCQLPPATKERMRAVYGLLAAELPNDPAALQYSAMLDQSLGMAGEPPDRIQAVVAGARIVAKAVAEAARTKRQLPSENANRAGAPLRLDGDKLSEYYVRQAAAAARQLPPAVGPRAFLLGLGVAMDGSEGLPKTPITDGFWQQIESSSERVARLAVMGTPTMRARRDLARHFTMSAALTVLVGPQGAEGIGILKELSDSRGGSGFSFVDFSADLSGIVFAEAVGAGKISLARLEDGFTVADFVSDTDGLKEGIGWDDFVSSYGYPPDKRLFQQRESIRRRILALPGHCDADHRN